MRSIHFANLLLVCILGNLLFWPENGPEPAAHESINTAYTSVCLITTNNMSASGVLLESGYVLTAAHIVDRNQNNKIDPEEKTLTLYFPTADFKTKATALASGNFKKYMDIAILKTDRVVPLPGVKLMTEEEYWSLKIGAPIYTIGMQGGFERANITDGRLITIEKDKFSHRNSANTYFGNSGGGVFVNNKLVGIASSLGMATQRMNIPIFYPNQRLRTLTQIGMVSIPYKIPMANQSKHVSAPAIRKFLSNTELKNDPLEEALPVCPYEKYFVVMGFNAGLLVWLLVVFKLIHRKTRSRRIYNT